MQLFFISILLFDPEKNISSNFLLFYPNPRINFSTTYRQATSCRSGFALRVIMHLISLFPSTTLKGKHTSYVGILASIPPRFPYTVAYGICSVPPHIPYLSASLRERSYASVALQPLPAASMFPFPVNLLFLKIFFSMR